MPEDQQLSVSGGSDLHGQAVSRGKTFVRLGWPNDSSHWREATTYAGCIWLVFTALRWTTAICTEYFSSPEHGRLQEGFPGVIRIFSVWDGASYTVIATNGYFDPTEPQVWIAFFPGLPVVVRAVAWVATGGQVTLFTAQAAGVLVATSASLIATILLFGFTEARYSRSAAVWAAVLLMVWPTAIFLNAVYTESLFLALALGAWYCAWRGRWWWAGLLCAGASFTRINGLILAGALLVLMLTQASRGKVTLSVSKVLAVCCGALGTLAYFLYLYRSTGDWLAWSHALEKGWLRHSASPFEGLQGTLQNIATQTDPFQKTQSVVDIFAVALLLVFAAYLAARRHVPEFAFTVVTLAVLASSTEYLSVMRYTVIVFPIFVIGGDLLSRSREWVSTMVVTLSGVWMIATTVLFTLEAWAG